MTVTEIRVKLRGPGDDERLLAYVELVFDGCFVVRDVKVIDGRDGPVVAMPSRPVHDHCPKCHAKTVVRYRHCPQCGGRLDPNRQPPVNRSGRQPHYLDVCHPITHDFRDEVQRAVFAAWAREQELAGRPDYRCRYHDEH